MLDRAALELRANQRLGQIEQARAVQKVEHRPAPHEANIQLVPDLRRLRRDQGHAPLERLALVQLSERALGNELPRPPVNERLVLGNDRTEVVVAEDAGRKVEIAVVVKVCDLRLRKPHPALSSTSASPQPHHHPYMGKKLQAVPLTPLPWREGAGG